MDYLLIHGVLLSVTGALAGFLAGLFGIGGGLVIVPALYFFLQSIAVEPPLAMALAIQTSLVSIIPTSLSSLRAHQKLNNVDWPIVKLWAPFVVLGVLLGSLLVAKVRSPGFTLAFGLLLLAVAIQKLFWPRPVAAVENYGANWVHRPLASIIGFISVCAGVGGGATGVPTMMILGLPIHRAIGSCAALGFSIALPGSISIFLFSAQIEGAPVGSIKLIYFPALLLLTPFTVLCAPFGARLGKKISPKTLTRLFALALVLVGLKMVGSAI